VALLRGEGTLSVRHAYREAIDKELRPFDIGLDKRGGGLIAAVYELVKACTMVLAAS
jgi:hypothetical protein